MWLITSIVRLDYLNFPHSPERPASPATIAYLGKIRHLSAKFRIHPAALACEAKTMYFLAGFPESFQ
jgi:hypothetical protein